MALVTPYCSVGQATVYLQDSATWNEADYSTQSQALFWGRVFLDSNYSCAYFDPDAPPDEIIYANALLAEDHIQGTLIKDNTTTEGKVSEKRVKAGSVESETKYTPGGLSTGSPQADVDALLHDLCSKRNSNVSMTLRV